MVVDIDTAGAVLASCPGGQALDVPANSLPALVDWTLCEPKRAGSDKDADPLAGHPAALLRQAVAQGKRDLAGVCDVQNGPWWSGRALGPPWSLIRHEDQTGGPAAWPDGIRRQPPPIGPKWRHSPVARESWPFAGASCREGRPVTSGVLDVQEIDLSAVREQVDAVLEDFLEDKARAALGRSHPPEVADTLRDFLAAGGKRIRALLCVVGWHAAGGSEDRAAVLKVAASLELFVAFALIHDDIMDDSATRRGRPAVHRALRTRLGSSSRAERLGAGGALLVGNLALIWAQELLHSAELSVQRRRAVHGLYDAMLEEVMYGQYLDVMGTGPDDDIDAALRIVRYKTATATVERPLQLGAAVAGADDTTLDLCTALGLPLGEAFQLRDDLLDVFGSTDGACTPGLGDLREGKRTVLLAAGLRAATPAQQHRLRRLVGRADLDEHGAAEVRAILEQTGARHRTERMITSRYEQVMRVLDASPLPPTASRALRGLAVTATQYTS
ncbi:polyprenyl synthetase family protein [Streptomyces sp. NPDC002779]|uniref:polyprenyl synthetase family protein n=1 Tax=Streptomyces sp. NPDC002779 TaxID=3364664 RepID=UPI0036CE6E01